MNIKEKIINIASGKIDKLKEKYPVSFEKINIVVDEESDITTGSGYYKPQIPDSIFIVAKYFKGKDNLDYLISKTSSHEFCHLYVNDKRYIEGGRFNKDIEKEIKRLLNKYKIIIDKNNFDISNLISTYATKNANVNIWHEALCEAFSLYCCYDYKKNENSLVPQAYQLHKELVDFLCNYKLEESAYIDELDIDYYMLKDNI